MRGSLRKTTAIAQYVDTVPDVFVIQRDMHGDITGLSDRTGEIRISLSGGEFKNKMVSLWINRGNSSYSGFVYFIYSPIVENYRVTALALDTLDRVVGTSQTVEFPSTAGNIEIPAFNVLNACPTVDAGSDTVVGINDVYLLKATATDSFGTSLSYRWKVATEAWFDSDGDTSLSAPGEPQTVVCSVMVTDDDGNVEYDVKEVRVELMEPMVDAGEDTTVGINDTIRLHGEATDESSIASYAWRFGEGPWITTSTGDTDIVAPSTAQSYVCSLRACDDEGNCSMDACTATVETRAPQAVITVAHSAAVLAGDEFELSALNSTDETAIVSYEWRFDGDDWVVTDGDTVMTAPSHAATISCSLRVVDDDGNASYASEDISVLESVDDDEIYLKPVEGTYVVGDTLVFEWLAGANVPLVTPKLSVDGGSLWFSLSESALVGGADGGSFSYEIPATLQKPGGEAISTVSSQCFIQLEQYDGTASATCGPFAIE